METAMVARIVLLAAASYAFYSLVSPNFWLVLVGIHGSQSSVLVCRVDDTGSFTVPSSSFALFPTVYDQVDVAIARVSETLLTSPAVSLVGATEQVTNPVALTQ